MKDKERRKLADETFEFWDCPGCGYRVTQLAYEQSRFNYPCPRCGRHNLSEFRPILKLDKATQEPK